VLPLTGSKEDVSVNIQEIVVSALALADPAPAAGTTSPAPCGGGAGAMQIGIMVLMFGVFYFLLIRPQKKRAMEHQNMLNSLQKGDEVITRGGVIGRIAGVKDNIFTLELQEKVRVKVLRSYVEGKMPAGSAAGVANGQSRADAAESKT
jgi:preprotein translocase subunit YajC